MGEGGSMKIKFKNRPSRESTITLDSEFCDSILEELNAVIMPTADISIWPHQSGLQVCISDIENSLIKGRVITLKKLVLKLLKEARFKDFDKDDWTRVSEEFASLNRLVQKRTAKIIREIDRTKKVE
jgi:hypothetical protein